MYFAPGYDSATYFLKQSSVPEYDKLAETAIVTKDWDEFRNYCEHYVMGNGTHAQLRGFLIPMELALGRWWRSKERLRGHSPYGEYYSTKKWLLNEVNRNKDIQGDPKKSIPCLNSYNSVINCSIFAIKARSCITGSLI